MIYLVLFTLFANGSDDDSKVVYKKETTIDFEGVDIEGELVKPQGALVLERKRANFNPLIKLRSSFDEDMRKSVTDIQ